MRTIGFMGYLLLCHTQIAVSQQIIEKKDHRNRVYERIHMQQNDTLFTDYFYENGIRAARRSHDTLEDFSPIPPYHRTRLSYRLFGNSDRKWMRLADNGESEYGLSQVPQRVEYSYYPNGQPQIDFSWRGDSLLTYHLYAKDGRITNKVIYLRRNNHYFAYTKVKGIDSIHIETDTIAHIQHQWHFQNQRLRRHDIYRHQVRVQGQHVSHYESKHPTLDLTEQIVADSVGTIYFHWFADDAKALKPDKDNFKCLYGFRNAQDEWAIAPQYDDIKQIHYNYFMVNQSYKYGILDRYGNVIVPLIWDFLEPLSPNYGGPYLGDNILYPEQLRNQSIPLLRCRRGANFGLIDGFGKMILTADYQDIRKAEKDLYEVKIGKNWEIVRANGEIVVPAAYPKIEFCKHPQIFKIVDTFRQTNGLSSEKYGLVQAGGKVLLPTEYAQIELDAFDSTYFWVTPFAKSSQKGGLYHPEKGWVLPLNTQFEANAVSRDTTRNYSMVWQDGPTFARRIGVYNHRNHTLLLPMDYEMMEWIHGSDYVMCRKHGFWGIWNLQTQQWQLPLQYEILKLFSYGKLLASKNGQYQIIDYSGKPLLNGTFDGGCISGDIQRTNSIVSNEYCCFLTRGDRIYFYYSSAFPAETDWNDVRFSEQLILVEANENGLKYAKKPNAFLFKIGAKVNGVEQYWYLHEQKKLLLKPPYQFVLSDNQTMVVRHPHTKHQYILDNQGNKYSFPARYEIQALRDSFSFVLVKDTLTGKLGIMDKAAKPILPCKFFGIALDTTDLIWARSDFDACKKTTHVIVKPDEWSILDSNWQMYDRRGQLLTPTRFDYAAGWHGAFCIGQVKHKQGLWNRAGQNVLAARYDKIGFDPLSRIFHLFERSGGNTYRAYFANEQGQLIGNESFINMSLFMNDTAFVETANGFGMIRRDGSYVVKPQSHPFQKATFPIFEQMQAQEKHRIVQSEGQFPPYLYYDSGFYFPASDYLSGLKDAAKRQQLGNFLMEQTVTENWFDGNRIDYTRNKDTYFYKTAQFTMEYGKTDFTKHNTFYQKQQNHRNEVWDIAVSEHYLSYSQTYLWGGRNMACHNFKKQNDIWISIGLNDIFNWNAAMEAYIHKSLLEKISLLKYQNIDCNNPLAFMETVKRTFYITEIGVRFFLPYTPTERKRELLPSVLFTWAELQSFLK
jgi:hypothetical protein